MNLTINILGAEVLSISTERSQAARERGDSTSYPISFGGGWDERPGEDD